jgi:hypothetical protein
MGRPSKIDRLPPELKNLIGELRQAGATIDEIMAKLKEMQPNIDISRSGLGVHIQDLDRMVEQIQQSRAVADALVARFGEQPDTRTSRVAIEMMHSLVLKLMVSESGASLSADEMMFLAKALQSLSSATKADVEAMAKVRREIAEKAIKAAEKAIGDSAAPDRAALVQRVRQEIYGLAG